MTTTLLREDHDTWVELTLNRPEKLNAFNDAMCTALLDAIQTARKNGTRAILITGAGRGFCAGQDLADKDPASGEVPDLGETLRDGYNPIIELITTIDCPVICAVNGVAAGAGASVALAADIVLAADTASFVVPFARIGLVPGAGSSWTLPRAIGLPRAKALALTGGRVTASQAADWGMIWQVVAQDDLMKQARDLAAQLGNGPTYGLAQSKRALNAALSNDLPTQMALEATMQTQCGRSRDYAEGVAAFRDKRTPIFTGEKP